MFEIAELGRKVSKEEYATQVPKLRAELLDAHFAIREAKIPVLIIVSGADAAGKGEVMHRLNEWLDPRGVDTHAFWKPSDEELERPPYWRFWRALPGRGRVAILFGSWYTGPMVDRVYRRIENGELDSAMDRVAFFERMLAEDGVLIIKLWYHLSKKEQRKRLQDLDSDPKTRWRVLPADWKNYGRYNRFIVASERVIRRTDTAYAPWHLIEASDRRYRELCTGKIILDVLKERLATVAQGKPHVQRTIKAAVDHSAASILDQVDLKQKLLKDQYDQQLEKFQGRLGTLMREATAKKVSSVVVFEGWDAAGKGSAIRRVTAAVDPRLYRIIPIAAPTDEERSHHYLWRFWRHLPRAGMLAIFDRSWYGRVLVERVEGFAREDEWMRAYLEINDFEEQLTESGIVVSKFWIHISKDEQMRRFKERQKIAFKRYKITDEDWRNRKKWEPYEAAINEMVARTSTAWAPWTIVAGNDKRFARVQIVKTLVQRLEKAL